MGERFVFTEWHGKPLDEVLFFCREVIEDPEFIPVHRWRAAGGKVIGHFQVYFPQEIVHAADALPVKVRGAPLDPVLADSRFGSYLCSILKTSLELALSGRLPLDMFVMPPICDAARNLAAIFARNVTYPCQILYLPQNTNSMHSAAYLRDEYARLKSDVETITNTTITDAALRHSIDLYNTSRRWMRELYTIKRDTPWLVSAEDAYCLVSLSGLLPVETFNALMAYVIPALRSRTAKAEDRIRVVFEGGFCEQPPLDLIRMIGRSCYIVDDDFLIGQRFILEDIPTTGDPLTQLALAYLDRSSYSPVQRDHRKPKEHMLNLRIDTSSAHAVILATAKMCEPSLEEQVAYVQALEYRKIPYFITEFEENMSTFSSLELQIEAFVERLLFD
jgi:benzoyl-CoA reductase subunit C